MGVLSERAVTVPGSFFPHARVLRVGLVTVVFSLFALSDGGAWAASPDSNTSDSKRSSSKAAAGQADVRVTKSPKLVQANTAEYTQEAIDNRIEGTVKLQLELDANGVVQGVKVLQGLGYGLDEAAIAAAKKFVFEPAEINNQPAAVSFTFDIAFSLPILPSIFDGRISDKSSGTPLDASITITYLEGEWTFDETPTATTRTQDGYFRFEEVPPGRYTVSIDIEAYKSFDTTIDLVPGKTSSADYQVEALAENLTGQVLESGTRTPLAGIEVQVLAITEAPDPEGSEPAAGSTSDGAGGGGGGDIDGVVATTYTDGDGRFGFRGLDAANITVRIASDGYSPTTENVDLQQDAVTDLTLYLEKEIYDEYQVTTTTRREETIVNRRTVTLSEIKRIPGTGGDLVRSVKNFPGVARAPFVAGAIIVRGSAPENTGIYLDGAKIPNVFHFLLGPSVINTEMIQSLDFYPGNFSTYFGHSLAGIIDLKTRSPKKDRIHGQIVVDLLNAAALVEGPIIEDLSFAVSARRSYIDAVVPLFLPKGLLTDFVAPVYYDYQGWLSYSGLEDHQFDLKLYGSDDRISLVTEDDKGFGNAQLQVNSAGIKTGLVSAQFGWKWRPTDPLENDFSLTSGITYNQAEVGDKVKFQVDNVFIQVRDDLRYRFLDELRLRTGFEFVQGIATLRFLTPRFDDDSQTDPSGGGGRPNFSRSGFDISKNGYTSDLGIYSELQIIPFDEMRILPGIRLDYFDGIQKISAQPRFSFRYTPFDEWTFKGGVGLFTQEPNILLRTDGLVDAKRFTFQKALQVALGVEYEPFDFLTVDVTGFYRNIWDLVAQSNAITTGSDGQPTPEVFSNGGKGRAYGVEVLLRHRPNNRFFGWLAYTLSWAEEFNPNLNRYTRFRFDQRHILTLVAGYNFPWNIDVGLRFRLVSGGPYTPITGGSYDADLDVFHPIYGDTRSVSYPPFHQLDLRVDKRFIFERWILGIYLDIQNVYWAKNREGTRYSYDFTQSVPITGLPILPTIGVSATF